jgi:NAD(P)-dependent dehydrogenase (short-subunit alcohol dehydrogenase family)
VNKVAMITGATRNTGFAIAHRFAQNGYDVVVTSRDQHNADEAVLQLKKEFPENRFLALGMNQGEAQAIRSGFEKIRDAFDRLDVFVGNAADLAVDCDVFNTSLERWNQVIATNVTGNFLCAQESAKLMKDGGSIVFISSVHANQSIVGRVAYSTSKAAIGGLMRSLSLELAYLNIRVNSIIAGAIWSDRWEKQTPEQTTQRRLKYPAGRESSTGEIAHAVAFLCDEESATITGTELTVDSGISICLLPYQRDWRKE